MNKEIDYSDQAVYINEFGDRRITSFWTSYGIKCIDSQFCRRIQNINVEVDKISNIDRVKETYIGRDGKEHEYYLKYKTVYVEKKIGEPEVGYGERVLWKNGTQYDFVYDDMCKFDPLTRKENPNELRKEILDNPHLHKDIKENLIYNLDQYLNENI